MFGVLFVLGVIYFILCVSVCLCEYLCTTCTTSAHGGQKRAMDPLELELQKLLNLGPLGLLKNKRFLSHLFRPAFVVCVFVLRQGFSLGLTELHLLLPCKCLD